MKCRDLYEAYTMKFTYCLSSVVFLMYFSVVVLVTVNGHTATDAKDAMIVQLREELAKSVGRIGKLEDLLAASVDIIAELKVTSASEPDEGISSTR